jgi:EAL domain-containing protein (putative c-di-GMP-specific phosphodiesterase class I)/AmiR/NasT family two-component response regulator
MEATQRVLVIDDEPDVGKVVAAVVRAVGLHCTVTTDVATFLGELTPDVGLILLDLMMPAIDGIEVLRLLSDRGCCVPIVLMSGVGSRILETAEQLAQTLGLTIIGYLNKPFRMKELEGLLESASAPRASFAPSQPKREQAIRDEELVSAIQHDELVLHYQPQIEFATGNVVGVEALVRWNHPQRGLIFPDRFIGRTEELGLIDQLGWITYDRGMSDIGHLGGQETAIMLSLNVSLHSIKDLNFPNRFLALMENHGISASNVTIEITESGLMEELSKTLDVLTRLRMNRVSLSIDDFGTGFAMMQQLRNVPATELKIDKSFVQNIGHVERDRVIVQKTIELGHELGMRVVGEGVETREQFEFLRDNRCDAVQGYLFSHPLPMEDLQRWLWQYHPQQAR